MAKARQRCIHRPGDYDLCILGSYVRLLFLARSKLFSYAYDQGLRLCKIIISCKVKVVFIRLRLGVKIEVSKQANISSLTTIRDQAQTCKYTYTFEGSLLKPFLPRNMPLFGCFHLNLLSITKSSNVPLQWSHAYLLYTTLPESTVSYTWASNPWADKLFRLIRPRVDFQSSSSSILRLSHDLGERESQLPGTQSYRGRANVLVQLMNQSNYRKLYIQFWLRPGL